MSYTKTFIPFPPLLPLKEGVFIFNKKILSFLKKNIK